MTPDHIVKYYNEHAIVWFKELNQFVIVNKQDAKNQEQIDGLKAKVSNVNTACYEVSNSSELLIKHKSFNYRNIYKVNGKLIALYYESEDLQTLINPKFDHLNVESSSIEQVSYYVYWQDKKIVLADRNKLLFQYYRDQLHELSGKISMLILNAAYNRHEKDWLAVFHASFVSIGNKGVLIIGDSGSGKSTAAAVLMANGMNVIADDFVPFNLNQRVNFFPAATSIKESADQELTVLFPELSSSIIYKSSSKEINVKYLKPSEEVYNSEFEISAVISIMYDPAIDFELNELNRNDFLSQIIPDTWSSPVTQNVNTFLDWIIQVPAYRLNYSNNDKLLKGITNLLDNE